MMKAEQKKSINHTYLILEEKKIYKEDYHIHMLNNNDIPGLLKVKVRNIDDTSRYYYNIEDKIPMKALYQKRKFGKKDILIFLKELLKTIKAVHDHILNINCLMLKPEYIYCDQRKFFFCYCMFRKRNIKEEFHHLTEFLIRQADYEDKEGIYIVYEVHKRSIHSSYNITRLLEDIINRHGQAAPEADKKEIRDSVSCQPLAYETDKKSFLVREERQDFNFGLEEEPMKKNRLRNKKNKWGDWEE